MKHITNPNHALTGRKQSEENIKKRVDSRKRNGNYIGLKVEKNGMYGKPAWNKGKKGLQFHSLKTRKLQSELKKGKKHSPKHIEHTIIGRQRAAKEKGYYFSEEVRQYFSKLHKGKFVTEETRKKLSNAWIYEKHVTEKSRAKQRKSRSKQIFPKYDTKPERMMQIALSLHGIKFEKQKLIETNDFYHRVDLFIEPNICVEVDGVYWHIQPKDVAEDLYQTQTLTILGYHVIRIRDKDILKNANDCAITVINLIKQLTHGVKLI